MGSQEGAHTLWDSSLTWSVLLSYTVLQISVRLWKNAQTWRQLTTQSRVPTEKLTVIQLVKTFLTFYGCRRFTTARHWSISWARWIQSTVSHPVSPRSVLILSIAWHYFFYWYKVSFLYNSFKGIFLQFWFFRSFVKLRQENLRARKVATPP
jgi:hypothetical protein